MYHTLIEISTLICRVMKRGQHPNSLANLNGGRPTIYEEEKKRRTLTVTESGWEGVTELVEDLGCSSVSDLLERLGRGQIKVSA